MPVKPPRGGGTHVDVPGSSNRPVEVDTSLPGSSGRRGVDPGVTLDNPQSRAGGSGTTDIDAIHPAPAVVVHEVPIEIQPFVPTQSLDDYVTSPQKVLPPVNNEGLRMINGRPYADLSEGGRELVLVAKDSTGLYRARRPSRSEAEGPVLLRNPDSGLWYAREIVEPTTRAQVKKILPEAADEDGNAFIARFETRPIAPDASLDAYLTDGRAIRAVVNSEGFRVINQLPYADLQAGGMTLVGADPLTGLYRARRPSELLPSGPVLLRNADSGLWYPRQSIEQTTREQVKKYLPEATDQQADDFVTLFGDKDIADMELRRVQLGFSEVDSKISLRELSYNKYSDNYKEVSTEGAKLRRLYKWLGEPDERVYKNGRLTGFKLEVDLDAWRGRELPSGQFKSISDLTLRSGWASDVDLFLAQFPNVESLKIAAPLGPLSLRRPGQIYFHASVDRRLVAQFKKLARLRELNLEECAVRPDFSVRGMNELRVLKLGSFIAGRDLSALVGRPTDLRRLQVLELQRNVLKVAPDVSGMADLRYLDLTGTGIFKPPAGLDADGGPKHLEVLKLGGNTLTVVPSVKGMTALRELDLSNTGIDRFPQSITSEIPAKVLNLANNRIASIPESVELRAGFNLMGNPITDPLSLRRLIHARVWTGTDIWLGPESTDRSADLWLQHLPSNVSAKELTTRRELWDDLAGADSEILVGIRKLTSTPEFRVEYPLLQGRVWRFLNQYGKADRYERGRLRAIVKDEPSPGKMLDSLEALIQGQDLGQQNQPSHHLPKRPRLE